MWAPAALPQFWQRAGVWGGDLHIQARFPSDMFHVMQDTAAGWCARLLGPLPDPCRSQNSCIGGPGAVRTGRGGAAGRSRLPQLPRKHQDPAKTLSSPPGLFRRTSRSTHQTGRSSRPPSAQSQRRTPSTGAMTLCTTACQRAAMQLTPTAPQGAAVGFPRFCFWAWRSRMPWNGLPPSAPQRAKMQLHNRPHRPHQVWRWGWVWTLRTPLIGAATRCTTA